MKLHLEKKDLCHICDDNNFYISEPNLADEELKEFLYSCLSEFVKGSLDPDIANAKPDKFIQNIYLNKLGNFDERYIIAAYSDKEKNNPIGILIALPSDNKTYHILSVHTKKEYRNKHIGYSMLVKCINDMYDKKINKLQIDVHYDNKPAYYLYSKLGFTEYSRD